jgi:hypothetical protein
LDVRVEFFRAQTRPDRRPTPWDTLAGLGVGLHPVAAPEIDHASMMREPHARILVAQLSRVLDDGADDGARDADAASHHAERLERIA